MNKWDEWREEIAAIFDARQEGWRLGVGHMLALGHDVRTCSVCQEARA